MTYGYVERHRINNLSTVIGDGACSILVGKGNPESLPSLGLREAIDDRLVWQKPHVGEERAFQQLRPIGRPQPFPVAPKLGDKLAHLPAHETKTGFGVESVEQDFGVGIPQRAIDFNLPAPIRGQRSDPVKSLDILVVAAVSQPPRPRLAVVDKLVPLIRRFQPRAWIAQILELLAVSHEAKTRADQQHPVDRALAILAPGSQSYAMKAAACLTRQPTLVLCLAIEFRAIGIGEFSREPIET